MQNDLKLNHGADTIPEVFGIDSPPDIMGKLTPGKESTISELVELIVNDSKSFNEMCFLLMALGGFLEQQRNGPSTLLDILRSIK